MKVFLSSTYIDLIDHRRAAAEAIERLGQQVGRMEVFGARPDEPKEACLAEIDGCDAFVGIYAHRYGYVPDGAHVSITEAEFNHARTANKVVFCFLVHEDHPWPPRLCDDPPGKTQLRTFKDQIGQAVVRDTFTTPEDLAYRVAASLGRYISGMPPSLGGATSSGPLADTNAVFFERILSEIGMLRAELRGQADLLAKVNRMSVLLQPSEGFKIGASLSNPRLPADLAGRWRDAVSGSTLYAGFFGEEFVVPYSYASDSRLTGLFFDFRQRTEGIYFGRFGWVDVPIHGFAYINRVGPDAASGGWWYDHDVPPEALRDLARIGPALPRMNDLQLSRLAWSTTLPPWVDDFFSRAPATLMARLRGRG